jgi:hypothetical protein
MRKGLPTALVRALAFGSVRWPSSYDSRLITAWDVLFESAESDLVALQGGGPPDVGDGGRLTVRPPAWVRVFGYPLAEGLPNRV